MEQLKNIKLPYRESGADCFGYYQQYFAKGFWEEIDLENIEPLLWCCFKTRLFQLRWNGDVKEETELDCDEKTYLVFVNLYAADISAQGVSFGFDNNP
jgi:hypothetical protein